MHQLISYIKFLLKSTNQHGVHSPFVYDFVTKCLYNKTKYNDYKTLKKFKELLLNSNDKTVLKFLKKENYSLKKIKLLYRVSDFFDLKNTLQLGTIVGLNSYALAIKNRENTILTIEESKTLFEFTKNELIDLKLSNATHINSTIIEGIQNLDDSKFDSILFNNNQNKEDILEAFNLLISKAHNNSVFIFDAIHSSKEMTQLWGKIISDTRITVSMDCFSLGFIFFRKEQPKQHFRIRL